MRWIQKTCETNITGTCELRTKHWRNIILTIINLCVAAWCLSSSKILSSLEAKDIDFELPDGAGIGQRANLPWLFLNFKILQRYDNPTDNFANSQLICTYCRVWFDWFGSFNFVSNVCYTHVVSIPTWPFSASLALGWSYALLWRHNGRDSVSNHQPHDCLLKRLFGRRSKITSKLRVTGLCGGIHRGPVNSPHKWPVTRKMFPFDSYWEIVLLPR